MSCRSGCIGEEIVKGLRGGYKVDGRQQEGREEELAACRLIRYVRK